MPRLGITDSDMQTGTIPGAGGFHYSAIRPEKLTATKYTLVTVLVDETGSVHSFADLLLDCLKASVESCRKSPMADNLLVRVCTFSSHKGVSEIHGYKPIADIDSSTYPVLNPGGGTNLYDAVYSGVTAMTTYAKTLNALDLEVNGALFVITDGDNNASSVGLSSVVDAIKASVHEEVLESLHSVLVGISAGSVTSILNRFSADVGFSQYVDAGQADANTLAKLAAFISKSITAQSQALGTGGPSKPLVF